MPLRSCASCAHTIAFCVVSKLTRLVVHCAERITDVGIQYYRSLPLSPGSVPRNVNATSHAARCCCYEWQAYGAIVGCANDRVSSQDRSCIPGGYEMSEVRLLERLRKTVRERLYVTPEGALINKFHVPEKVICPRLMHLSQGRSPCAS